MKKTYMQPTVSVSKFTVEDIIKTSGEDLITKMTETQMQAIVTAKAPTKGAAKALVADETTVSAWDDYLKD